jgi:hypothetical protein
VNWEAAVWGGAGGLIIEVLEFHTAIIRTNCLPWQRAWRRKGEQRPTVLIASVVIRVLVGAAFAGVTIGGDMQGDAAALFAGAAAPTLFLEKLGRSVKGIGQQFSAPSGGQRAARPESGNPRRQP